VRVGVAGREPADFWLLSGNAVHGRDARNVVREGSCSNEAPP
jgi:hypothetical protein